VINKKDKEDFAVTECYKKFVEFPSCKRRKVEANFGGGDVTSDGGALLLCQVDRRLALSGAGLARAQCNSIRLKLLKIGAVVLRNTRRVRLLLSSSYSSSRSLLDSQAVRHGWVLSPARYKQWG